jgi:hypothetical protein
MTPLDHLNGSCSTRECLSPKDGNCRFGKDDAENVSLGVVDDLHGGLSEILVKFSPSSQSSVGSRLSACDRQVIRCQAMGTGLIGNDLNTLPFAESVKKSAIRS